MKKLFFIVVLFASVLTDAWANSPKTIMLVLGSDNAETLTDRVQVAFRLYGTQKIDRVIVSGGCAAHQSQICEATLMYNQLVQLGVPPASIYKEENAKTTVQNYIFSRRLKDEQGHKIISPGDTVYVVSNHWHAISVAARLQKYDSVIGKFYIEGSYAPKLADKVDYVSIFNGQEDNEKFIWKGMWLTPDAVWSKGDSIYYLMQDLCYVTDTTNEHVQLSTREAQFPYLPSYNENTTIGFVDAGKDWLLIVDGNVLTIRKSNNELLSKVAVGELITGIPKALALSQFTCGVVREGQMLLFSQEHILIARKAGRHFHFEKLAAPQTYFTGWPFSWGKGNVAGATYDKTTKEMVLYRNQEYVRIGHNNEILGDKNVLKLKWIDDITK